MRRFPDRFQTLAALRLHIPLLLLALALAGAGAAILVTEDVGTVSHETVADPVLKAEFDGSEHEIDLSANRGSILVSESVTAGNRVRPPEPDVVAEEPDPD